ncbi:MAG: RND transporter [Thiohalomonadales bacterium]
MKYLDKISILMLALPAIFLAFAPFRPQPHLWQKLSMLFQGELSRTVDIFDLFWHSIFLVLLALKLLRVQQQKRGTTQQ